MKYRTYTHYSEEQKYRCHLPGHIHNHLVYSTPLDRQQRLCL